MIKGQLYVWDGRSDLNTLVYAPQLVAALTEEERIERARIDAWLDKLACTPRPPPLYPAPPDWLFNLCVHIKRYEVGV